MYKENLMDHFEYPRNKKNLSQPDFIAGQDNPSCGDNLSIQGIIVNGVINDLGFFGAGCVISQASASMLTEICIGKTVDQVLQLTKDDILTLVGVPLGPTRLNCAMLSLQVLRQGLAEYQSKK